jgi:hypothetical protein
MLSEDLKQQISIKVKELGDSVPDDIYNKLINALSHEPGKIYRRRVIFIKRVVTDGNSHDHRVLSTIIDRLSANAISKYDALSAFRLQIDKCLSEDELLICFEARMMAYLDSLCTIDANPVLREPFHDSREAKHYILTKIYHIFMKKLREYPAYYKAYEGKCASPYDYEKTVKRLLKEAVSESGEKIDFSIKSMI